MVCPRQWRRHGPGGLAVIPVEEEQGKGAHDEEEEDPDSEACVVFDGLAGEAQVSPWTACRSPRCPHTPLTHMLSLDREEQKPLCVPPDSAQKPCISFKITFVSVVGRWECMPVYVGIGSEENGELILCFYHVDLRT